MMSLRVVGVCDDDPFDALTWSGSAKYFFEALHASGALVGAVSSDPYMLRKRLIQLCNFHVDRQKWRFAYHLSPALYRARTEHALNLISNEGSEFDYFLQIGAWFDFTGREKPVISYHDGNLARRLNSPYPYPAISARRINKALKYERELYSRIDLILPMSHWLKRSFVEDFGVEERKVQPVYAGINLPDVTELPVPHYHSKSILFVGKDFERKGGRVLLEAFAKVKRVIPDSKLVIVGPDLDDVPEGVVNPGFISKNTPDGLARLKELYLQAAVFALPTRYEPFGIAFAEAMAHALPCVGTDTCAVPEIISEGVTGFTIPVDEVDSLADRLIQLLRNPKEAEQFGRAGFERYRKDFNWPAVVEKIHSAVKSLEGI